MPSNRASRSNVHPYVTAMDRLVEDEILLKLAYCCTLSTHNMKLHSDSGSTQKLLMLRSFITVLTDYHNVCIKSLTKSTGLIEQLKPDLDRILTAFVSLGPASVEFT